MASKEIILSIAIPLAIAGAIGGSIILDSGDKWLYLVQFDTEPYQTLSEWVIGEISTSGEEYRDAYEEYIIVYEKAKKENRKLYLGDESKKMENAFNTKLKEIRDNCHEDDRCVRCKIDTQNPKICKIMPK